MNPGAQFYNAVRAAVNAARDEVDAVDDPAARLAAASDLVTVLEGLYNQTTGWRALMAYQQYTQGVRPAEIARRTRRSPQRVQQLIKAGRKLAEERADDTTDRGT